MTQAEELISAVAQAQSEIDATGEQPNMMLVHPDVVARLIEVRKKAKRDARRIRMKCKKRRGWM